MRLQDGTEKISEVNSSTFYISQEILVEPFQKVLCVYELRFRCNTNSLSLTKSLKRKKNEYFRTRLVLFISRVGVFIVLLKSVKMERQQKRWYQMVLGRVKTAGIIWPLSRQITMKRMEFWSDFLRNFENKIQIGKNEYVLKKRYCVNPL